MTLDEVEEAKLPGSGTIRLSQIKTEFGGANNLKDYYGAASGIPNSGTIKLTDFYGKEKPPTGVAPYGTYGGSTTVDYQSSSVLGYMVWLATVTGSGYGSPISYRNRAGWKANDGASIGPDGLTTYQLVLCDMSSSDIDYIAQYPRIRMQVTGQVASTYSGSWSKQTITTSKHGSVYCAVFSSSSAGQKMYDTIGYTSADTGKRITISSVY